MSGPGLRPPERSPFLTVSKRLRYEIEPIKKSRFITDLVPISCEQAAQQAVDDIRAELSDARHHCWAYTLRSPETYRSSDDGEPGGSAGRPILAQLQGRQVFNLIAIVTRYFGGTKLGVGGLVRAYGGAVAITLDRAELVTITPRRPLWIEHDYGDTAAINNALSSLRLAPARRVHTEHVTLELKVPDADWKRVCAALAEGTSGRVRILDK